MTISFDPYRGDDPYLFASYGHCDSEFVVAELNRLHRLGYRVWYDRGIRIGRDWADEIEEALRKASVVLVFLSPESIASKNVRDEIHFALDHHKTLVPIYLEKFELQGGMRLRLASTQAILKHKLTPDEFADLVRKTLPASLANAHATERTDIGTTLGIDFGTRNSVMAIQMGGRPEVLLNREGRRSTPSVVAWDDGADGGAGWLTGAPALAKAAVDPANTFLSLKTKLGSDFSVSRGGKTYRAWQLIALFLERLREDASLHLRHDVRKAVVTVPVRFSRVQTEELCQAYAAAGFDVVRVTSEPTAVSLAYGGHTDPNVSTTAIYDLGAGSFDVSILDIGSWDDKDGGVFECIAVNGDVRLGGDDFDAVIAELCVRSFEKTHAISLDRSPAILGRILHEAELAKIALTAATTARVHLPYLVMHNGQWLHLDVTVTRAEFEAAAKPLVDRTIELCEQAVKKSSKRSSIQRVIIAGMATQVPGIRNRVRQCFQHEPVCTVDPGEAVALGAAEHGDSLQRGRDSKRLLIDVQSLPLGVKLENGSFIQLVAENRTLPCGMTERFLAKEARSRGVSAPLFEGLRPLADDNVCLGTLSLPAHPGWKEDELFEVRFDVSENSMTASLTHPGSGLTRSIVLDLKRPSPTAGDVDRRSNLELAPRGDKKGDKKSES